MQHPAATPEYAFLNDERSVAAASDAVLAAALSRCLGSGGRVPNIPPLNAHLVMLLAARMCGAFPTTTPPPASTPSTPAATNGASAAAAAAAAGGGETQAQAFYCAQQLRQLCANFFVAAAKSEGYAIASWFVPPTPRLEPSASGALMDNGSLRGLPSAQHMTQVGSEFGLDDELALTRLRSASAGGGGGGGGAVNAGAATSANNTTANAASTSTTTSTASTMTRTSPSMLPSMVGNSSNVSPLAITQTQQQTSLTPHNNLQPQPQTSMPAQLVAQLLEALVDDSHSLVAETVLSLFLQHSPTFLHAFVAHRAPLAPPADPTTNHINNINIAASAVHKDSFFRTAFGMLAPLLTDTSALRNHAAWRVLLAAVQTDPDTRRPSRVVVEHLSRHLHAFIELLARCVRHANPASRRFALSLIGDILQLIGDWQPISHCILQSPAIFFAVLANTEGAVVVEHFTAFHILKMFISFPKKCPLMRHLCFMNRDALGAYVHTCSLRFQVQPRETELILSRLAAMGPLTAEEAALVHCAV